MLDLPIGAVTPLFRLVAPEAGQELVHVAAGHDGDMYALWSSPEDADLLTQRTVDSGGARFANTRTARPVRVVITAGRDLRVVVEQLELAFPVVAPLPGGRTLIVGARAWWRPDSPEENAIVVDAGGEIVLSAAVGDGVADVQTTPSGQVWIGFHDEGVFGNFGWGTPDGPEPIGASGIMCLDPDLTPRWDFDRRDAHRVPEIHDCYALNVVGEQAWSCYYGDFPIVRIDAGRVTAWRNDAAHGARALAVGSDDRVALAGGYGAERDRLVEGNLVADRFEVSSERRLSMPDGTELSDTAFVTGRGAELTVVEGLDCYRWTIGS